jgi:hypothetical protein
MGTNGNEGVTLEGADSFIPMRPRMALSNSFLFITFKDNGKLVMHWGRLNTQGGVDGFRGPTDLLDIGDILDLKIIARGNIALVAAIERVGSTNRVRAAVGQVSGQLFTCRECPPKDLPEGQIVDLLNRINDDGSSDDFVCVKPAGSATGVYGHHPPP